MKKKLLPLLAATAVIATALAPIGIGKAVAASYYPGYTCYYRDIAGRCLSYQQSTPHYLGGSYGHQYRSPYGNRQTYPFRAMFNAYSTNQHRYDNRYSNTYYRSVNPYYRAYRYEEDDDDNNYLDEDDDAYDYYYGDDDDEGDGETRWYYDEDDDYVRPYRYQTDDDDGRYYRYDDDDFYRQNDDDDHYYRNRYDYDDDDYYEQYESTKYYCNHGHCRSNY